MLSAQTAVGVVGCGTMGSGIAQVFAQLGHPVTVCDSNSDALTRSRAHNEKSLGRLVEKGILSAAEAESVKERLTYSSELPRLKECGLVIEAIIERLEAKQTLFQALEALVRPDCILATNTSSLSVAAIAGVCKHPSRVLGLHFFNPAPLMPLLEIVPHVHTDADLVEGMRNEAVRWGKVPVVAKDYPGFIVNRIARPFYGEALRLVEEQIAQPQLIDWAMKTFGGFRMGPFELMDLIGNDVNYAVSESVFSSTYFDPRYRPSIIQRRMVEAGLLGQKTGRGFYKYEGGKAVIERMEDHPRGQAIFNRILAMLINEATEACYVGTASAEDIETAMTRGVNYPRGLLAWCDAIGAATVLEQLEQLQQEYGDPRYRPSVLLRRHAQLGSRFF